MHSRQGSLVRDSDFEIQKESDIENLVKKHLEVIVLSILKTQPMCGQDIVKEIFRQYQVFINQSSVYQVLYTLKEKNILEASTTKGDMRSKVYIPTNQGSEMIYSMLDEFVSSMEYLLMTLKEDLNYKRKR
ncbi:MULTISPECIES: PadR family transcriptional regulator [unclassified Methanosarcina]|uniref:PadR family transcriptional regulator n=1 Tax=unclassified Methanosarcina TaxID=2644672 RepID=UPI00260146E2|nr:MULTISPECIES: helix-turn-helix transcriptional regulator [unclassified Methanosarcina]